jgi:hypothetical protein
LATRELTSERRAVTSDRDGVIAVRREAPAEHRALAHERRRVPAMGEDVPVTR